MKKIVKIMENIFTSKGRICRSEFWRLFLSCFFILFIFISGFDYFLGHNLDNKNKKIEVKNDYSNYNGNLFISKEDYSLKANSSWNRYINKIKSYDLIQMTLFLSRLFIIFLIFYVIFITLIKRLHDINKSGWYVIFYFIPYLNIIVILYCGIIEGTKGKNRFGEDSLK